MGPHFGLASGRGRSDEPSWDSGYWAHPIEKVSDHLGPLTLAAHPISLVLTGRDAVDGSPRAESLLAGAVTLSPQPIQAHRGVKGRERSHRDDGQQRSPEAGRQPLGVVALLPGSDVAGPVVAVCAALYVAIVFRVIGFLGGLLWLALLFGFATGWLGELSDHGVIVALFGVPLAFAAVRWRAHQLRHQAAAKKAERVSLFRKFRQRIRKPRRDESAADRDGGLRELELSVKAIAEHLAIERTRHADARSGTRQSDHLPVHDEEGSLGISSSSPAQEITVRRKRLIEENLG